jgi:hypothetical protein
MVTKEAQAVKNLLKFLGGTGTGSVATRAGLGVGAGAYIGNKVTPKLLGFSEDPGAVNASTLIDAATWGSLAGAGSKLKGLGKSPLGVSALIAGMLGEHFIPVGMQAANKGTAALNSATEAFNRPPPPTLSEQARTALTSPTARGAGAGAGAAGLLSLVSGLTRPGSTSEREKGTGRAGMVTNDFAKYVVPAMMAGGLLGNTGGQDGEE